MKFDKNDSPYLSFPPSHPNLIITPPRLHDGDVIVPAMSDPAVYLNLNGPPFPYTRQSWEEWYPIIEKQAREAIEEWREVQNGSGRRWVSASPVSSIREVGEDGEERFVGEIMIRRAGYITIRDEEERKRVTEVNNGREAGDPLIEWEIGYYLIPAVHGRGIMPAALKLMLHEFWIPQMNVQIIEGSYFTTNTASKRVFEKNGFVFVENIPDVIEINPLKVGGVKGKMASMGIMKWVPST